MRKKYITIQESFTVDLTNLLLDIANLNPDDTVCDPFAGAGLVGLEAYKRKINSINIEKDKATFNKMKSNFSSITSMQSKTFYQSILGDSESININKEISAIITSPAFTISETKNPFGSEGDYSKYAKQLTRIFNNFLPLLKKDGKIIVVIGRDIFRNKIVKVNELFKNEMLSSGYRLIKEMLKTGTTRETKILIFTHR